MKKVFWLIGGVAAGLFLAKRLEENPRAQAVVDDAAKRAKEFGAAIAEGFREREAELAPAAEPKAKPAVAARPVTKKTAAKKPAAKKTAASKTTTKKPAASKTAAKKSAAKPEVSAATAEPTLAQDSTPTAVTSAE